MYVHTTKREQDMIKNIIFDMGNVLTIYNAREYIYGYVDNEEDFRWMKDHLCASVEWLQMDRGTITVTMSGNCAKM